MEDAAAYSPTRLDESALKPGQIVECRVLEKLTVKNGSKVNNRGYLVDIGTSQPAFVPRSHVALKPNLTSSGGVNVGQGWATLPQGLVLEGQVLSVEGAQVNVSFVRVQRSLAWQRVAQLADADVTIGAQVLRLSEAGATLNVEGLPAFMPWSHWSVPPEERSWKLLGEILPVKFLEAESTKRRLVVSNRRVRIESATATLEPGSVVEGTVKAVRDYGAVVSLTNGLEGLLHVSQISQVFVKDVEAVFGEGDPVRCVVIKVDADDGSISLSTKMLEKRPGEMARDASAVFERGLAGPVGAPDAGEAEESAGVDQA